MVNGVFSGCDTRLAQGLSGISALSLAPAACLDLLRSPLGFLAGLRMLCGLGAAISGIRKRKPLIPVVFGILALTGGWLSLDKWSSLESVLVAVGGVLGTPGLARWTSLRKPATVPELTLRGYVGQYDEGGSEKRFTFSLHPGHLVFEHGTSPGRCFTLDPSGANRSYLPFPEANITFLTNSLGHESIRLDFQFYRVLEL